jgi:hypothetical protein
MDQGLALAAVRSKGNTLVMFRPRDRMMFSVNRIVTGDSLTAEMHSHFSGVIFYPDLASCILPRH